LIFLYFAISPLSFFFLPDRPGDTDFQFNWFAGTQQLMYKQEATTAADLCQAIPSEQGLAHQASNCQEVNELPRDHTFLKVCIKCIIMWLKPQLTTTPTRNRPFLAFGAVA
jgi:hypothetical protein